MHGSDRHGSVPGRARTSAVQRRRRAASCTLAERHHSSSRRRVSIPPAQAAAGPDRSELDWCLYTILTFSNCPHSSPSSSSCEFCCKQCVYVGISIPQCAASAVGHQPGRWVQTFMRVSHACVLPCVNTVHNPSRHHLTQISSLPHHALRAWACLLRASNSAAHWHEYSACVCMYVVPQSQSCHAKHPPCVIIACHRLQPNQLHAHMSRLTHSHQAKLTLHGAAPSPKPQTLHPEPQT